jgi:serine protease Do
MNRKYSFAALLLVVFVSVIFGMVVGGKLNAPAIMHASGDTEWLKTLQPASDREKGSATNVDFADIVEEALPGVVRVVNTSIVSEDPHGSLRNDPMFRFFFGPRDEAPSQRSVGFGSGFIVSEEGYILTNNHVVEDATRLTVELSNDKKYDAEIVGADPSVDLAVLKIDPGSDKLHSLPLGDSDEIRVGEWVAAIGNPLQLDYTVTVGVVSAKARNFPIGSTLPGVASFIQTDAAINLGNSGGPLLDTQGRVVGINTAILRSGGVENSLIEGVGFALPINVARDSVEQLLETGSVERGFLGIRMNLTPLDENAKEYYGLPDTNGVLITEVTSGTPAERAGLKSGDIIRTVDGEVVKDNVDLLSEIATRRPGDTVKLEVFRKGKTRKYDVELMSRSEGLNVSGGRRSGDDIPDEARPTAGLGFEVENLTPVLRRRLNLEDGVEGVVITRVDASSEAAEKGISPTMVVTSLEELPITDVASWNRALGSVKVGDVVKVELLDRGQLAYRFLKVRDNE